MALFVKLFINAKEIANYSAVRVHGEPGQLCEYRIGTIGSDQQVRVSHHYDDGAEALAAKVLLHELTSKRKKQP